MRFLLRSLISLAAHALALLAADYFIPGFSISHVPTDVVILALAFTVAHAFVRPVLKLVFSPIILITLGFFTFVINAGLLYALDFYLPTITISGLVPLLYATVLTSAVTAITASLMKLILPAE